MPAKAAADGAGVQVSGRGGKGDRESTPRVPVREVLDVDVFVTDAGTQVRLEIDDDVVAEYAEALAENVQYDQHRVMTSDCQPSAVAPGVAGVGAAASLT